MNIAIKNLQKRTAIDSGILSAIKRVVRKTLKKEGRCAAPGEITVCLVDARRIRKLNLRYLGKDSPTDVMTFDLTPEGLWSRGGMVVDVVVSAQTALSNAKIFKTAYLYELLLYVVHGLLHVLGYDDKNLKQRKKMQKRAQAILGTVVNAR